MYPGRVGRGVQIQVGEADCRFWLGGRVGVATGVAGAVAQPVDKIAVNRSNKDRLMEESLVICLALPSRLI